MTIRLRLTLLYSAILGFVLLVFGIALYFFLQFYIFNDLKKSLREQTDLIQKNVAYQIERSPNGWNLFFRLDDFDAVGSGIFMQITNFTSGYTTKSSNLWNVDLPFSTEDLQKKREGFYSSVSIHNSPFLIYSDPLILNGKLVGVLQAAYNVGVVNNFLSSLRWILVMLSVFVVLLAMFMGWFFSRRALKPIYALINATKNIKNSEDFSTKINYKGPPDEIGLLSETMNSMLQRIDSIYGELEQTSVTQRKFVADASHELRTPLTTISGNAEFLVKLMKSLHQKLYDLPEKQEIEISLEALNDITDESLRMGKLVNDLLSLARADGGFQINKEVYELQPIVETVIRKSEFMPKSVEWAVGNMESLFGVYILADRDYLQQLLFIFIENAFKFTYRGFVNMEFERIGNRIGLFIKDTGIGMDNDELNHIFDRFYRADSSRGKTPGTGLGLSIAKWILDEHEGVVEVTSSKGKGSIFKIWLPIYIETRI
ncbi:HAMP domain-containing sensor histidine kinase [Paenibacillus chondroitinus]|uniref:histidine kinase n=1 Tax=Paenibacillus chondroitinus TaxID=59842 RepID=A0ABU6DD88_9BACL|nr:MULTISPECIES: HAMP domain-containing sensor histidine kinase [Paenibacillus]MCY9658872.1 HAMP domain-containing histidine kinase [Paenibacillus anseongense]MEB4795734.1 HAMP domain-containing sensor histidine kinase [Paenibacillus chondroitinus]